MNHGDSGTVDVTDWKAMHDSVLADCLAREAERDRYREALEGIAATEAAMVPGRKWVHWRTQAEEALS